MKPRKRIAPVSAKQLKSHPELAYSSSTIVRQSSASNKQAANKRKAKPRARNPERQAKAFAHDYHSVERVEFVKSLDCVACMLFLPIPGCRIGGLCENAHTGKKPGKGLKSHYSTIVPLGRLHHRLFDERLGMFVTARNRAQVEAAATGTEGQWLAHVGGV